MMQRVIIITIIMVSNLRITSFIKILINKLSLTTTSIKIASNQIITTQIA